MNEKKSYMLVHSNNCASHDDMKGHLNAIKAIDTWRTDITNCFYMVSSLEAVELAKEIRQLTGDKGRFIISEVGSNSNGWLTSESWYLLRNKKSKPKD